MGEHGDTRDLRLPAEAAQIPGDEVRTRRRGDRDRRRGWLIIVGTVIVTESAAIVTNNRLWHNASAELFAMVGFVALIVLGGQLIAASTQERQQRPVRDRQRVNAATHWEALEWNRKMIERLTDETRERYAESQARYDEMLGYMAAVPHQLKELTERIGNLEQALGDIPNYGKGVIDGVQMRQEVFGDEVRDGLDRE